MVQAEIYYSARLYIPMYYCNSVLPRYFTEGSCLKNPACELYTIRGQVLPTYSTYVQYLGMYQVPNLPTPLSCTGTLYAQVSAQHHGHCTSYGCTCYYRGTYLLVHGYR